MLNLLGAMPPDPGWTPPLPREGGHSWMYPICIVLGFTVAIVLACIKMWKRYKISTEPFYWFIIIGVPTAILGARFGSCAIGQTQWSQFFVDFGSGLAIEWGVMFTALAAFIYFPLVLKLPSYRVRNKLSVDQCVQKVSMWMYLDAIVPAILIAQFIGRWGNYCNQEVFGIEVTDEKLAWFLHDCLPGMYIKDNISVPDGWYQPLFLWEGLGNLAMFFVLYIGLEFVKQRKSGDLAGCYFIWYGVFRACLEPLRSSDYKYVVSIVTSIVWAILGVIFILANHLLMAKVRDKKVFHTLRTRGPSEVFKIIGAGWNKQDLVTRYQDVKYQDCVRKPQELIYFGEW